MGCDGRPAGLSCHSHTMAINGAGRLLKKGMTVLQTIGSAMKDRFQWAWVLLALVVVVVATLFFGSWYTIDQGERGVHLRNGAVVGSADPGLGFAGLRGFGFARGVIGVGHKLRIGPPEEVRQLPHH